MSTQSKRREAFLIIIASLLAMAVLVMYLSSRIAINVEIGRAHV